MSPYLCTTFVPFVSLCIKKAHAGKCKTGQKPAKNPCYHGYGSVTAQQWLCRRPPNVPMDFTTLALITHLIGTVMGVGGATCADVIFLGSTKDKRVSEDELRTLKAVSYVIIAGLAIAVVSGIAMITQNTALLAKSGFQIKATIVLLLTVNGTLFHTIILPLMKKFQSGSLANEEIRRKLWMFAATGGTSVVSWYSVLVLGVVMRQIDWPYFFLLNGYLVLVSFGALFAYVMLSSILFPAGGVGMQRFALTTPKKFPVVLAIVTALLTLTFAVQTYAVFFKEEPVLVVSENVVELDMRVIENEWKWDPDAVTVPVGSLVRISIFNEDFYAHGFAIDALGVDVYLPARKTTIVEFAADTPGTYGFYCSVVCGEGHADQKGTLTISE